MMYGSSVNRLLKQSVGSGIYSLSFRYELIAFCLDFANIPLSVRDVLGHSVLSVDAAERLRNFRCKAHRVVVVGRKKFPSYENDLEAKPISV